MAKHLRVIDPQNPIIQNYFPLVFQRGADVKPYISRRRWLWLCTLEVLFGQELLESLVNTASLSGCPEDPDKDGLYGKPMHLNLHIPSGLLTNWFRTHLVELLFYKFYLQYKFIEPVGGHPYENHALGEINLHGTRFRFNKSLLYLVIPFRRVYIISAVAFTLAADLCAYLVTSNISTAIVIAVVLEFTRRLFKL